MVDISDFVLILSITAAVISFIVGFLLVYGNLKKVNLIEREKFNVEDIGTCIIFAGIFSAVWVVLINLFYGVFRPNDLSGTNFIQFMIIFLILMLMAFPVYNATVLARPTSDATTNFDKKLEEKFLDRFKGKKSYIASFGVFLIIYFVPVFILYYFLDKTFVEMLYLWFAFIPLIFLSTFSASGQIAGIISTTYSHQLHIDPREERYITKQKNSNSLKDFFKKIIHIFTILIAWIPFISGFYTIYSSISKGMSLRQGETLDTGFSIISFITLCIQVIFAVYGFFSKYWRKKSKTKTIDFMFSVWIFIAISINILINFSVIAPNLLNAILSRYSILQPLNTLFSDPLITLPLISTQGFIMVFFGGYLLINRNTDFHADLKLNSVNRSFGLRSIDELQKAKRKEKKIETVNIKDLDILVKSVLLYPLFDKNGVDLHKSVRKKSQQYLYLAAYEDEDRAKKIVEVVAQNTIEYSPENIKNLSLLARIFEKLDRTLIKMRVKLDIQRVFFSKEGVQLLGQIGQEHPKLIMQRLISAISKSEPQMQKAIFDAIGDIGEGKKNISKILKKLGIFMTSKDFDLRKRASDAITEMIIEGDYNDNEFVSIALEFLYRILEENSMNEEIVENALETILNLTAKVPKQISLEKIYPFLEYKKETGEFENLNHSAIQFVIQYSLNIIAYCVYYNLESFPLQKVINYLDDAEPYIRYVACDAIGNYILLSPKNKSEEVLHSEKERILEILIKISIDDADEDVREMAIESISEFLVMNEEKGFEKIKIDGQSMSVLQFYLDKLGDENTEVKNRASEAIKAIGPTSKENIYDILETHIKGKNLEVTRDLTEALGLMNDEIHKEVDLTMLYDLLSHQDPKVRENAVFALGMIGQRRYNEINLNKIIKMLKDERIQIRLQTIYALGLIGKKIEVADLIIEALINGFFHLDRTKKENISEVELYAESLGNIGSSHPSNEIVITLQQALIGDTNVYAKDVIAKALYKIGEGMIKRGNAKRVIENEQFYNQISWLRFSEKEQFTIGNIIIILIEAIQLKGVPTVVMNEISDSLQDLLPAFLFVEQEKNNKLLLTIKDLLEQAYYSNYDTEILETIDRIDSLISFKGYFEEQNPLLQYYSTFFAKSYSPDGKQFYDQGMIFMHQKEEPKFIDYAIKSFETAIDLAPNEFFTPDCYLQLGKIHTFRRDFENAKQMLNEALEAFASLDNINKMKEAQKQFKKLEELKKA